MRKFTLAEKTARSSVITEFTFRPVDGKPISSYSPGQYTTIWTYPTGTDKRQPRHYSLISEPGSDHYTIAVKKESQGMVSSFLHDRTAVGDEFDLSPPFGNFSVAGAQALWTKDADAPVVLLSAGASACKCCESVLVKRVKDVMTLSRSWHHPHAQHAGHLEEWCPGI